MASTTLMTFLLYTNPNVKSVKLLGSWDNFSKPYVMERDRRVGPGQWRGCYTFSNIICDGSTTDMSASRSGGLKMGGTYWYYYLLDNDVEYYNEAEPVTTLCPLLPGQPVNVLYVPIILPDSQPTRPLKENYNSQTVAPRTMNPEDKYMNPRQPPKPNLLLRTSPPLLQQPTPAWSFSTSPLGLLTNRGASQPSGSGNKPRNLDTHRALGNKIARSVSPPRSRGLRAAFRYLDVSGPDLNAAGQKDESFKPVAAHAPAMSHTGSHENANQFGEEFGQASNIKHNKESHSTDDLLLRRPLSAGIHECSTLSIQGRRALHSKSMERLSSRSPLTLETRRDKVTSGNKTFSYMAVELLAALESPSMLTAKASSISDATTPTPFTFKDKRLPTLPNTPSSVMDQALRDIDALEREIDAEHLVSRFSDFTETEESVVGSSCCERSHFSEWSTDTELISPESMTSESTFHNGSQASPNPDAMEYLDSLRPSVTDGSDDLNTPRLTVDSKPSPSTSIGGDSPAFNLPIPRLSISLSPCDLDIPSLYIDDVDHVERNPKRHAAFFGAMESIEGLGLTHSPDASANHFPEGTTSHGEKCDESNHYLSRTTLFRQSATTQEMMDELSYLKNMIQSGTGEI